MKIIQVFKIDEVPKHVSDNREWIINIVNF